jgi:putative ABC transport system permease protein
MDLRLLRAALWRNRGVAGLAVLAVAIGCSVAAALMHVSGDVSRKLTRELRALGPNLLVVPAAGGASRFLDADRTLARMRAAGVSGVPLLYVTARYDAGSGRTGVVQIVGTDFEGARVLHPSWKLTGGDGLASAGVRLRDRLGFTSAMPRLRLIGPAASTDVVIGGSHETGGSDDDALWVPLATAQQLAGLAGRASVVQGRIDGGVDDAVAIARVIERGGDGGIEAVPLHALTATEGRLLDRMRRLMLLVTLAALAAAGMCAFGALSDLALERRRDIALMKALGATPGEIVRQFAAEALAIGIAGGGIGWALGFGMAQVIGREVFHSAIALRWDVPLLVLGLALVVSGVASLGPVRLALGIEPALALKGE